MVARFPTPWPLLVGAFALLAASAAPAFACQYCRMGGDPQACLDRLKTDRSGELRLDAALDRFDVPPVQAAPLAIVTSAADLPARPRPAPAPVRPLSVVTPPRQSHLLDFSLLGLAVAGGVFGWRTRRPDAAL